MEDINSAVPLFTGLNQEEIEEVLGKTRYQIKSFNKNEGSRTISESFKWESDNWSPVSRSENIYNKMGVLAETYFNQWNAETNAWFEIRHMEYLFDDEGRKTEWISTGRDKPGQRASRRGHQIYKYDVEGKLSEVLGIGGTESSTTWTYNSKRVYYWSLHSISGKKGVEFGSLKVYPNPFEEYTTLELPEKADRI